MINIEGYQSRRGGYCDQGQDQNSDYWLFNCHVLQLTQNIIIKHKIQSSHLSQKIDYPLQSQACSALFTSVRQNCVFCIEIKCLSFKIYIEFLLTFNFQKLQLMKTLNNNQQDRRKHRTVSTFLKKTYELLNNSENNCSIRWSPTGIGFIILNEDLFSKTVLPKYFKHSNYSSFVRQLNMYNFHKIRENSQQSYFHHQHFNAYDKEALAEIKRKPEKKKKKNNQSQQENSEPESITKIKKTHKIIKPIVAQTKVTITCSKEVANSHKKVESQKNTENMFEDEGNCSIVRLPVSQSSDQLSMQVQQEQQKNERHMPGVPTKQLINASKNNILPLSMSVQNVHTSIMSIFY